MSRLSYRGQNCYLRALLSMVIIPAVYLPLTCRDRTDIGNAFHIRIVEADTKTRIAPAFGNAVDFNRAGLLIVCNHPRYFADSIMSRCPVQHVVALL